MGQRKSYGGPYVVQAWDTVFKYSPLQAAPRSMLQISCPLSVISAHYILRQVEITQPRFDSWTRFPNTCYQTA
jgi:hypothetical protein